MAQKKIIPFIVEDMAVYDDNVVILCKDIQEANKIKDIIENHSDIFKKYYNWSGLYLESRVIERNLINDWHKLIK